jgi:hypothetical protein
MAALGEPDSDRGQRIAIHASARKVDHHEVQALLIKLRSRAAHGTGLVPAPAAALLERVLTSPAIVPLSSVLCLATLGEPIRDAELARQLGTEWANDSDRQEHSNYGWPLTDIEILEPPIPARGELLVHSGSIPASSASSIHNRMSVRDLISSTVCRSWSTPSPRQTGAAIHCRR